MARNPLEFIEEVRQEVSKVTWPTWKEVWITTVMVLIMVALASLFFLLADQALGWLVQLVLGIGQLMIEARGRRLDLKRATQRA